MNDEALMMLMARAPKEPDEISQREFWTQFGKDYPPPEINEKLAKAVRAVRVATGGEYCEHWGIAKPLGNAYEHWRNWGQECYAQFVNDWPAIWARKMMEIAKCTSQ